VNDGWTVANTQLAAERAGMAKGWHIGVSAAVESDHIELSRSYVQLARRLGVADDPHCRQLIGEAFVIDTVHELTTRRVAVGIRNRTLAPSAGAVSSLMAASTNARRTALLSELCGPTGIASPLGAGGPVVGLDRVCTHRIGGGTTEMQRNAVAERHLGLPREPSFDRDVPFNRLKHNVDQRAKSE
jgi:alkylation response protein AidB-like acyl-CoA dehydrogenase